MKILVINAGSSSLKFQIFAHNPAAHQKTQFTMLCKGIIDGIGLEHCQFRLTHTRAKRNAEPQAQLLAKVAGDTFSLTQNIQCNDHKEALKIALNSIIAAKIISSLKEIKAIGHRVVHGGEKYHKAVKITAQVTKAIGKLSELAPLHNPPNLKAIQACQHVLKGVPQVAVFDTSFHTTIPKKAFLYALPYEFYTKDGIRRYGFHGTSHQYVSEQAIKLYMQQKASKIISCHLGNGSSVTAILNGKSIDTSMGLTPLEGIPMGTRSGDIDPDIIFHLLKHHKQTPEQIEKILLKESGLKGISGISSDVRDIYAAVKKNNLRAKLTFAILSYKIAKYIGSYAASMNGLDAIIFTGGIGENAAYIRKDVCSYLTHLGVALDPLKNKKNAVTISTPKSKVKVFVIPTNEEEQIAKETFKALS